MDRLESNLLFVIDDDHDDFFFLKEAIGKQWPTVDLIHFDNPKSFLENLHSHAKPGLIILDINMPFFDGFEVCMQLKQESAWSNIPIVFLSTSTNPANQEKALSLGAVSYLVKPTTISQWKNIVDKINDVKSSSN